MPIYYLEPNTRIRVDDMTTNIHGDYMIKSINLPIGGGAMSISASRIKGLSETLSWNGMNFYYDSNETY